MEELTAKLLRWLLAIPADQITGWHFVFLAMGGAIVVVPPALRYRDRERHRRFVREATPAQLEAYKRDLPPPPNVGGSLVVLALLLTLGLTGRSQALAQDARSGVDESLASAGVKGKCSPPCEPPLRCVGGGCQGNAGKKPKGQPPKPVSEWATYQPDPLWMIPTS